MKFPGSWQIAMLEDGRRYFFNTVTRETSWDRPVEIPPNQFIPISTTNPTYSN